MGTHPNAMLQCVISPAGLSRKTAKALYEEFGKQRDKENDYDYTEGSLFIGGRDWSMEVMEESYAEGYQISAEEGDIVLHLYLTYGYGETEEWTKIVAFVEELKAWAEAAKDAHQFSYAIRIGANYW